MLLGVSFLCKLYFINDCLGVPGRSKNGEEVPWLGQSWASEMELAMTTGNGTQVMTKGKAVRAIFDQGVMSTAEVKDMVRKQFGLDVAGGYIDSIRSEVRKEAKKGEPKKEEAGLAVNPESKRAFVIRLYESGIKEPVKIVEAAAAQSITVATNYVYKILGEHKKEVKQAAKVAKGGPRKVQPAAVARDAEFEKPLTKEALRAEFQALDPELCTIMETVVNDFGNRNVKKALDIIIGRRNLVQLQVTRVG